MNTKDAKKLTLKRETLRTLVVSTNVRAGLPALAPVGFTSQIAPSSNAAWTTIIITPTNR